MMRIAGPAGTLIVVTLLSACAGSPAAPAPQAVTPSVVPTAPPESPAPPATGTRVFVFTSPAQPSQGVNWYTPGSRFLLYEDGRFTLEYPNGNYRGTYKQEGAVIAFSWEGTSGAGPWGAEGSLSNGQLTVRYNWVMMMSDFDDAIYTLQPPSS